MAKTDDFRKQVNELWKQAVEQLEDVKDALTESRGRFEADIRRLRDERDSLLRKLGEQTYRLVEQDRVPLPAVVRRNAERLNEVLDRLMATERKAKKAPKKAGKKKTKKKTAKKKTAKKKTTKKKTTKKRS